MKAVMSYIAKVGAGPKEEARAFFASLGSGAEEVYVATIAEQLKAEGREQGLAQGREQGLAQGREQGLAQGREQGLSQGREQGLAQGREQGLSQGREQGLAQGQRALVLRQLERRFGALDEESRERVDRAPLHDLERWAEQLLTAATLEDALR
jgi:flagellar biosynthesis/type III secretory pathway protein FliH